MAIQLASDRVSDMNPDLPDLRASAGPLWGFQSVEVCRMKLDMREAWGRCKEKGRRRLIGPVNDLGGKGAPCDSPLCLSLFLSLPPLLLNFLSAGELSLLLGS